VRVLSFDPGQESIGYSVLEKLAPNGPNTAFVLTTGVLKHNKNKAKAEKDINNLVSIFKPDVLAFEETGSFLRSIYANIIKQAIAEFGIPAIALKVEDIRSYLYDNGNMSKAESNYILKDKIFNLRDGISSHELDAISVGFVVLSMPLIRDEDKWTY
jgi:Holliday junction resolvasome RuvABC endonuclease subunit